jgi:hypothetical protein
MYLQIQFAKGIHPLYHEKTYHQYCDRSCFYLTLLKFIVDFRYEGSRSAVAREPTPINKCRFATSGFILA